MKTIALTGLFAFSLGSVALAAPAPAETGNAANGQKLFIENLCYSCHGTMGAGGGGAGPKLAPGPIPMAAFSHQLRSPLQRMPPYTEKVLSDAAVADIHAYLASIPRDKPASEIAILNR